MCAPSAPPPADYRGAAEETAAGSVEAARIAAKANRPNEYTPLGSRTWQQESTPTLDEEAYNKALVEYNANIADLTKKFTTPGTTTYDTSNDTSAMFPKTTGGSFDQQGFDRAVASLIAPTREQFTMADPDIWMSRVELSPESQALFSSDMATRQEMANLGLGAARRIGSILGQDFTLDQFGEMPGLEGGRQRVMDTMLARVNEQNASDRDTARSNLIASGIPIGSEAYNKEMARIDRTLTDARQQAELASLSQGMDTRKQAIQEALLARQTPINELSAIRSGSQVQMPVFGAGGQQQPGQGANLLGATQAAGQDALSAWGSDVSTANSQQGAIAGMVAAYL